MSQADLTLGMSGDAVAALQAALQRRRFYIPPSETATGYFGPATQQAVVQFQTTHGLQATGVADERTRTELMPVSASAVWASPTVPALQQPVASSPPTQSTSTATPPSSPPNPPPPFAAGARTPVTNPVPPAPTLTPIAAPAPAAIPNLTLNDLATVLPATAAPLLSKLASQGIQTLADVRHTTALSALAGQANAATIRLIQAHADLARLSSNVSANASLISAGFDSTLKIARAQPTTFLAAAVPVMGLVAATGMQVGAAGLYQALDQVVTSTRVDLANGVQTGLTANLETALSNGFLQVCECCDCQNAQSPGAYLADLLSYITTYLLNRRVPVTLDYLVDNYYQPFADLPTDCEAVDNQVRQVRICIEVLRGYLATPSQGSQTAAMLIPVAAAYLLAAYNALLAGIGTTYQELRLARRADPATRYALAQRLGLTIDPYGAGKRPDQLDKLILDPPTTTLPVQPNTRPVTEARLEHLFGLADSTRNPLADGLTLHDPAGLIMQWNLTGVSWNQNTSPDGTVYVTLSHASPSAFQVSLYSDSGRTNLVASGQQSIASGPLTGSIAVVEQNSSGLSGVFVIASATDDSTIELSAVPLLTSWQLQTLGE